MRRSLSSTSLVLGLIIVLAIPVQAQQQVPAFAAVRLTSIAPAGGKIGSTIEATIAGFDFEEVNELWFSHPAIKADRVGEVQVPKASNPPTPATAKFKIGIPADVAPGAYDVRVAGKWGLSNPRVFIVGGLDEIVEQETNNDLPQAQKVPLNTAITGSISANTDVDYYTLEGKKGIRVILHCAASSIDSRLTPMLEIFDAKDRRMASSRQYLERDALLDVVLPADGAYFVRVCEFAYQAGNADYFYRLSISNAPWIDAAFPPIVEPGKANKVALFGRNLPGGQPIGGGLERLDVTVDVPADALSLARLDFPGTLGGEMFGVDGMGHSVKNATGPSSPILLTYARAPVVLDNEDNDTPGKAQKISLPCEVAGRFEKRGDRDRYQFQAKQGEVFILEGFADRLGSPFDMFLEVRRSDNNQVVGEFDDNADQPAAFGKFFTRSDDPRGRFTAPADGTYELLVGSRTGDTQGGPRFVYRVSITREEPDFRLVLVNNSDASGGGFTVRRGGNLELQVVCLRNGGFTGEVTLTAEGLPDGVTCLAQTLGQNQRQTSLVLSAGDNAPIWLGSFRVKGTATTVAGDLVREARAGCIVWPTNQPNVPAISRLCKTLALAVRDPGPFSLGASVQDVTVPPGGQATVRLSVKRSWPDFKGQIQLTRLAAPSQANGQLIAINNTTINANQNDIEIKFSVPTNVPTGTYNLVFLGTGTLPFARDPKGNKTNVAYIEASAPIRLMVFTAAAEVSVEKPLLVLKPGSEDKLNVKVKRLGSFQGDLTLQLTVPDTLKGVAAAPVTISGKQDTATLVIKAEKGATLGVSKDAVIKATAKQGQQTVTAAVSFKLAVTEDGTYEEVESRSVPTVAASSDGWRFMVAAKVQGDKWRMPDFDDNGWKKGKAPLGYGEEEIATRKGTTAQEVGPVIFRRTFDLPADIGSRKDVTYRLAVASDNSAIVYVNGEKVDEDPEEDHEYKYWNREVDVPAKFLKPGKNVIAVLVKNTDGSSDLFFDLELSALVPGGKPKK